jgi:hypothetical protein
VPLNLAGILPPSSEGATRRDSWGDPDTARERMHARFDAVSFTEIDVPIEYPNVDEAWVRMREGRPPFALAYGRMPVDQVRQEAVADERMARNFCHG